MEKYARQLKRYRRRKWVQFALRTVGSPLSTPHFGVIKFLSYLERMPVEGL
jgi:hypothetical protein